jgi:transcriptional regulator with XRE-family HTH domain
VHGSHAASGLLNSQAKSLGCPSSNHELNRKLDHMDTIGKRITHARENKGYTCEQLAERVGVKEDTLQAWENDERDPRANRLLRLAGGLDVTFAWLMVGDRYDEGSEDAGRLSSVDAKLQRMKQLHSELGELIESLEGDMNFMLARDEELEQLAELDEGEQRG